MDRIFSIVLRIAEIGFGAIVAGVNGNILDISTDEGVSAWDLGRFIYVEAVAGVAVLLALLRVIPFSWTFTHWPVDLVISLAWWAAFGLMVDQLNQTVCGDVFSWSNVSFRGDPCGKFKSVVAFSFLSALIWLVSAFIGFFWTEDHARASARRRRWRWSYV